MNKKQEKLLHETLKKEIEKVSIISVANGYKASLEKINNMITEGNTLDDIRDYCELIINGTDKIIKVKMSVENENEKEEVRETD